MDKQAEPLLSLVVPCYNEQEVIPLFYRAADDATKNIGGGYRIYLRGRRLHGRNP